MDKELDIWDVQFQEFWHEYGLTLKDKHDAYFAFTEGWRKAVELMIEKLEARYG